METVQERLRRFFNSRWLVFVASMWIQSCAGVGYLFGSISPVIKSTMGYTQKQVSYLSVAKNLGDCVGFIAGALCEILPFWGVLTIGVVQNFVGYGLLWLIVTKRLPSLPLWVLCIAIFVGTNGETYYNTAALVSCVQNFSESRGLIVGILKGFSGLSGAILSQIYHMFSASNQGSLILMIAIGPSMVVLSLMFMIRSVDGHQQRRPSDGLSFSFVYGVCLLLAAYLTGYLLLDDLTILSQNLIILSSVILLIMLLLPSIIPIIVAFFLEEQAPIEESLLSHAPKLSNSYYDKAETINNNAHNEVESEDDSKKPISQLQANLIQAAAGGAVIVKRRRGPRLGENFTLLQALVKTDFWLMFVSLVLASGSGITVIDNIGQICQSLGHSDTRIFVSMISICNYLGRIGGGYFSELVVRNYAYPRPAAMATVQVIMAFGFLYYTMAWPAAVYILTVVIAFGYGAFWAIALAAVSELFGLQSYGALYNFSALAMPIGSFIFSSGVASSIYDYYADMQAGLIKQATSDSTLQVQVQDHDSLICMGTVCYSITCAILSGVVLTASVLSMILVRRTKSVYAQFYATQN